MRIARRSKLKVQRVLLDLILLSAFSVQLSAFLTGCAHLPNYSQPKKRLENISPDNLEGLSKVETIKKFGQPIAISQSEVSECWYYAQPAEMWIWFSEDKVDHWESN